MPFNFEHNAPAFLTGLAALTGGRAQGTRAQAEAIDARNAQLMGIGSSSFGNAFNAGMNNQYQRGNIERQQTFQTQRDATQFANTQQRDRDLNTMDLDRALINKHGVGLAEYDTFRAANPDKNLGDFLTSVDTTRDNAVFQRELGQSVQQAEQLGPIQADNAYRSKYGATAALAAQVGLQEQYTPSQKARMSELHNQAAHLNMNPNYTAVQKMKGMDQIFAEMQTIKPMLAEKPDTPTIAKLREAGVIDVDPTKYGMFLDAKGNPKAVKYPDPLDGWSMKDVETGLLNDDKYAKMAAGPDKDAYYTAAVTRSAVGYAKARRAAMAALGETPDAGQPGVPSPSPVAPMERAPEDLARDPQEVGKARATLERYADAGFRNAAQIKDPAQRAEFEQASRIWLNRPKKK